MLAGVVATTGVQLGAHVAVMPSVVLTHDDVVCDFATLGSGARLAGDVTVGEGAYIGAGALSVSTAGLAPGPWWGWAPASRATFPAARCGPAFRRVASAAWLCSRPAWIRRHRLTVHHRRNTHDHCPGRARGHIRRPGVTDAEIQHEVEEGMRRVMDACAFVNGPDVAAFESAWAGYCGAPMPWVSPTEPTRSSSPFGPRVWAGVTRSWCRLICSLLRPRPSHVPEQAFGWSTAIRFTSSSTPT